MKPKYLLKPLLFFAAALSVFSARAQGYSAYQHLDGNNILAGDLSRNISLYPNPADGVLNIRLESNDFRNIRVVNSVGQIVWLGNSQFSGQIRQLNSASWVSGIYTLQISEDHGQAVKKIVIRH